MFIQFPVIKNKFDLKEILLSVVDKHNVPSFFPLFCVFISWKKKENWTKIS